MKLYQICIDIEVERYEHEIREVEFDKTFNYIKLKLKNNIVTPFLDSINNIDFQFADMFIISFKPFSESDIKKLTRYIRSHKKE